MHHHAWLIFRLLVEMGFQISDAQLHIHTHQMFEDSDSVVTAQVLLTLRQHRGLPAPASFQENLLLGHNFQHPKDG
ncbi:hypothetical protein AAY473_015004, partial [Plecturocebus cupreus]